MKTVRLALIGCSVLGLLAGCAERPGKKKEDKKEDKDKAAKKDGDRAKTDAKKEEKK